MRVLRRLLVWGLGTVAALLAVLALSIPLDALLTRGKVATLTNTPIPSTAGEVAAYVAPAPAAAQPAVIMIHEFWGLKPSILGKADALAQEGYFVVAPDTFRGQTTSWLPRAIWQTLRQPEENLLSDLDAVYRWLVAHPQVDPERIMVMGFCYGGGAALRYSLTNTGLSATGIFYGSLTTDDVARLPGPVLGIFGAEDRSIPVAEVNAFEAALSSAGVPHDITLYDGVGHAFVKDIEDIRAGGTDAEAWTAFLAFADNVLKN